MLPLALVAETDPEDLGPDLDPQGIPRRPMVIVDADVAAPDAVSERAAAILRCANAITVAVSSRAEMAPSTAHSVDLAIVRGVPKRSPDWVEVTDPQAAVIQLRSAVSASPVASLALCWLLRGSRLAPVRDALTQESAVFSALLAGSEFRRWLARRGHPRDPDGLSRIRISRDRDVLTIILDRVARRNAIDARMRDALREAVEVALRDPVVRVEISGSGPSFSAGGDLDEFGAADDPAIAHLVRVEASLGAALERIRDRVTARVHGVCMGAGIEIPAFAGRLVAAPDAQFALPEIAMGLIPGAGGTVSITRRIGSQRMLWMALTGVFTDARTALGWGLVDAIE